MNKFTLFETSIIGLFVGVIMATYIAFLESTGKYIGTILNFVSLRPLVNQISVSFGSTLLYTFLLFVFVFVVYGLVIGFLLRGGRKIVFFIWILILLIAIGIIFEQSSNHQKKINPDSQTGNVIDYVPKVNEQYFGKETVGDLNGDKKDDVAFFIVRNDQNKGDLYYLAVATKIGKGHLGTNMIFLGNNVFAKELTIKDSKVNIEYVDRLDKKATTTKMMYAQIIGGVLKEVNEGLILNKASSTQEKKI
jgi:hypothetical protein